MTIAAKRDDIKPVLDGIPFVMVIVMGLLAAVGAFLLCYSGNVSPLDMIGNMGLGFSPSGIFGSGPSQGQSFFIGTVILVNSRAVFLAALALLVLYNFFYHTISALTLFTVFGSSVNIIIFPRIKLFAFGAFFALHIFLLVQLYHKLARGQDLIYGSAND